MELGELSRRRAIWAVGAAGVAALGAADSVRPGGPSQARAEGAGPRARAIVHQTSRQAPPEAAPPRPLHPGERGWRPTPIARRRDAVFNLRQLERPEAPKRPKTIALTIDDGPHPTWTPRVLDLLAEHKVTATFFVIGEQVREYPKLVRRIADEGHPLCNHTYTHPMNFARLGARRMLAQVRDTHASIGDTTGITPQFFRSPGGAWNRRVYELAAEYGMVPVGWEIDPSDWSRPGVGHIRRTLMRSPAGAILLCHDGGGERSQTLAALRTVLPKMKQRGYTFASL